MQIDWRKRYGSGETPKVGDTVRMMDDVSYGYWASTSMRVSEVSIRDGVVMCTLEPSMSSSSRVVVRADSLRLLSRADAYRLTTVL